MRMAPMWIGGLTLLAAGVLVLVHAFARFVVEGLGTPAPVAPTEHLVMGGLYRYVRNPMYLAVGAIILGQALALGQAILLPTPRRCRRVAAFVHWIKSPPYGVSSATSRGVSAGGSGLVATPPSVGRRGLKRRRPMGPASAPWLSPRA